MSDSLPQAGSSIICVSIGRGRHKHMIAEHKHLAERGAKLVELRLDYIATPVNLRRLIPERPCPVVITCRRERDGGKWLKPEEDRLMLLRQAIAAGVEYVDLEEDIAAKIPRYGKTTRATTHACCSFQSRPKSRPSRWGWEKSARRRACWPPNLARR
jgi:3-dehydroquinate dehydratase/shikimate dehydrogenase